MSRLGTDSGSLFSDYPDEWAESPYEEENWEEVYEERQNRLKNSIIGHYEKFQRKSNKIKVTCPYDKDVFEWFKTKGRGYHRIIDAALKAVIQAELDEYGEISFDAPISNELRLTLSQYSPDIDRNKKMETVTQGIWYSPEVIRWFKSKGHDYKSLMNMALRTVMEIEKEAMQEIDMDDE